ncbi:hypothetical protein ACUN9Z_38360, partial [Escherichia sp. HC-CC4]
TTCHRDNFYWQREFTQNINLLMIYALSGVFYAFGGMLEAGRIGSATNNLGFMYELDAIAACVVGGVSFSGGVGTVIGV